MGSKWRNLAFFTFQNETEEGNQLNAAEKSVCLLILPLAHFQGCLSLDFKGRVKSPWFGNLNWVSFLQLLSLKTLDSYLNFLSLASHIQFVSKSCPLYLQNISMLSISHHLLWEHPSILPPSLTWRTFTLLAFRLVFCFLSCSTVVDYFKHPGQNINQFELLLHSEVSSGLPIWLRDSHSL